MIKKAVFPVAGLGTRFLPATKASPKEMLPVVDKPLIQYAVEEALSAGINELIFITGRTKRSIEDHFDKAFELETELEQRQKHDMLELVKNIVPRNSSCIYIRQIEALGLGHAVQCARAVVGNQPFAVILADDLIDANTPVLKQMVEHYNYYHSSLIGVQQIQPEESKQYGVISSDILDNHKNIYQVNHIVEKPKPEEAPSNLGVVGRYILNPKIFEMLEKVTRGAGGEIQLTDAIELLLKHEQVLAYAFDGTRYDCGSKLGYLQATINFALKHHELKDDFKNYLIELSNSL